MTLAEGDFIRLEPLQRYVEVVTYAPCDEFNFCC